MSRRERGSGSLEKRGTKWQARYRANGKDVYHTFPPGTTKDAARKWLNGEIAKVNAGTWVDPKRGRETVAQVAEIWFASLDKRELKPKTKEGYRGALDYRIIPRWGNHQLRHVTTKEVRAWVEEMATEGLAPASQRGALQVLGAVMRRAVKDEMLSTNPLAALDNEDRPKVRKRRQRFLSHFELKALSDAAEAEMEGAGLLVTFLGRTGLRWGEATALKAGNVKVADSGRVKVSVDVAVSEVNGRLVEGTPKTHERRVVIPPAFVSQRLLDHIEGKAPSDLVFTTGRGSALRSSNFRLAVWRPAVEAAGVPDDLMVHDLRDTAASLAISSGASVLAVQRMLGHSSAAMTLDVYASLFDEDLEALADRMEEATPEAVKEA